MTMCTIQTFRRLLLLVFSGHTLETDVEYVSGKSLLMYRTERCYVLEGRINFRGLTDYRVWRMRIIRKERGCYVALEHIRSVGSVYKNVMKIACFPPMFERSGSDWDTCRSCVICDGVVQCKLLECFTIVWMEWLLDDYLLSAAKGLRGCVSHSSAVWV